jgi:hypothetical protein
MAVTSLINISDYYLIMNQYRQAENYARQALKEAETLKDKQSITIARVNLGLRWQVRERFPRALS